MNYHLVENVFHERSIPDTLNHTKPLVNRTLPPRRTVKALDLITTEELAAQVHVSPNTVRYWRYIGTGPRGFKAGKRVFYRQSDIEAWLEQQYAKEHPNAPSPAG
jgi:hypothetical protein